MVDKPNTCLQEKRDHFRFGWMSPSLGQTVRWVQTKGREGKNAVSEFGKPEF